MKLAPKDVNAFLNNPTSFGQAVLIYGPDSGLVSERAKQLIVKLAGEKPDPFQFAEFSEDRLKEDTTALYDELRAMSFTGQQRLVIIRDAGDKLAKTLEECLTDGFNAFLVVTAGELTPRSSLRGLFEKQPKVMSMACYSDEGAKLTELIRDTLNKEQIRYSSDVVAFLEQKLGSDRRVTMSELQKLVLYAGDEKEITLETARLLVDDSHEATLDEYTMAMADGDFTVLDELASKLFSEGIPGIAALRSVQRYFQKLHYAQGLRQDGASVDQAISQLKPPVFFKLQPRMKRHLERWDLPMLQRALQMAQQAELQAKSGAVSQEEVCRQCGLMVARLGRTGLNAAA